MEGGTVPLSSSATGSADDSTTSRPLTPHDQPPRLLAAGITKVAHLQVALKQQHPPALAACLQSMLMTMPPSRQAVVVAAPTAPTWQQGLLASGNQLIQNTLTGQCHSLTSHGQLQQSIVQAASAAHPVRVISWDPSRPWRGPTRQPSESASTTLYSQGQLWGPNHLSIGVWGWGQQPAHQLIVRQANQRLRLIQAQKHGILSSGALVYRPRLLPLPGSNQTSAQALQGLESKGTASMQASPASRVCLSSDLPDSQPAWMAPSRGHRQHWLELLELRVHLSDSSPVPLF